MKRHQRRRHLIAWLILAPTIVVGFALALMARTEVPVEPNAPINASSPADGDAD